MLRNPKAELLYFHESGFCCQVRKWDCMNNSFPTCSYACSLTLPTPLTPLVSMFSLKASAGLLMWTAIQHFPWLVEMKRCVFFWELYCSAVVCISLPLCGSSPRKNRALLSLRTKNKLLSGGNIYQIVNLSPSPSPIYSSCHSSPFSQWPVNSRLMADSDGTGFSCLRWHSQISKYFLVECSIFLAL